MTTLNARRRVSGLLASAVGMSAPDLQHGMDLVSDQELMLAERHPLSWGAGAIWHRRHPQSYRSASAHPGSALAGSQVGIGSGRTVQQGLACMALVELLEKLSAAPRFPLPTRDARG